MLACKLSFLRERKTNFVMVTFVIARSGKVSSPVAITEKVLALLRDSKES